MGSSLFKNDICVQAIVQLFKFMLFLALVRFTKGIAAPIVGLIGVHWVVKGEIGKAFSVQAMLIMMSILNPYILNRYTGYAMLGVRFGSLLIAFALICRMTRAKRAMCIPLGGMIAYMIVACISSITGYNPLTSYMKIFDFMIFFLGVYIGSKGISQNEQAVFDVRSSLLALATFFVLGSLAIYPFPAISTLSGVGGFLKIGDINTINNNIMTNIDRGGLSLFCGVASHSQGFAPILSGVFGYVVCDMLFVEKRFRILHGVILVAALPMFYLSRSRVGFTSLCAVLFLTYFYLPRKIYIERKLKGWLTMVLVIFGIAIISLAGIAEARSQALTRWLRKTDMMYSDYRTFSESFTSSREGLIQMCLDDFRSNPLLGKGFQVSFLSQAKLNSTYSSGQGLWQSIFGNRIAVSTEKGILPLMLLGETGIVGLLTFIIFLVMFSAKCVRNHCFITLSLMGVYIFSNFGETTIFTNSVGGCLWMFCVIGGFAQDLALLSQAHPGKQVPIGNFR